MIGFTLSREQELLREVAREWAQKEVAPKAAEIDRTGEVDLEIVRKYQEQGFDKIILPKELGGQGRSHIDLEIVLEEIAAASMSVAVVSFSTGAAGLIEFAGTDEAKKKWISQVLSGNPLMAWCATEADAGTDAASYMASATPDGDGWILNGVKAWTTNVGYADVYLINLRTGPSRYRGMDFFLVPKGTPGVRVGKLANFEGLTAIKNGELILENCRVPRESQLTEPGTGFYQMMKLYEMGRLESATMMLGVARAAFEACVKYAKERKQFGKPIGDFQIQQVKLAEMATDLDTMRWLLWRGLEMEDMGLPHDKESSMAKWYCADRALNICRDAVRFHGAIGYTKDMPLMRYFRDVMGFNIGEGTCDINKMILGARVLGRAKVVLDYAPGYE